MDLYMEQAEEYRDFMNDSGWNKMLQYYALMSQSHPFLSVRALEVREWCGSDLFKSIMDYKYERGSRLVTRKGLCPGCGRETMEEWEFCRYCGHRLRGKEQS